MKPIGGWRKDTDNDANRSADRKAKRSTNRRALNADEKEADWQHQAFDPRRGELGWQLPQ